MSATTQRPDAPDPDSARRLGTAPPTTSVGTTTPSTHSRFARVAGFPPLVFAVLFAITLVGGLTGTLPDSMLAGFACTMLLGGLLIWLGNLVPFVRDFGLPTILCTFLPATIVFFGLMPENVSQVVASFVDGYGFLDFFVISVIAGSILGMPRALLVKAGPRFAVPLVGCLVATFAIIGLLGLVTGFGFAEAVLLIAAPIMAGGLGVGALPMSEMYGDRLGTGADAFFGDLVSAVVLANIVCILVAGLYNGLGRRRIEPFKGFNGYGQLLRGSSTTDLQMPPTRDDAMLVQLGRGLVITAVLFVFGQVVGHFAPALHPYAWTIILAAVVKIVGLLPKDVEEATSQWGDFVTSVLVPALLVGVSITYISVDEVLESIADPRFILLTIATVLVAALSSGAIGYLVRMHFVEASITPGLVMADTGGSGDVSVLSAAGRMHLMPFAALTNRLGGALVLFVTSLLVPLLG